MAKFRVVFWCEDPWNAKYDAMREEVVDASCAEAAASQVRDDNGGDERVAVQCVIEVP